MQSPSRKAAVNQLPVKFNFLAGRRPPSRREWPLGHTPAEAQLIAITSTKRGAK